MLLRDAYPPVLDAPDALWCSRAGSIALVRLGAAAVAALGDWLVLGVIGTDPCELFDVMDTAPRELTVALVGARLVVMASFIALIVPLTSCWVGFAGEVLLAVGILAGARPPLTVLPAAVIVMAACCVLVPVLHVVDMRRYAAVGRGVTGFLLTPDERRAGCGRAKALSGSSLPEIVLTPLAVLGFCAAGMIVGFDEEQSMPNAFFSAGFVMTVLMGVFAARWWSGVVARRAVDGLCSRPVEVHLVEWQLVGRWVLLVRPGSDRSIAEVVEPVLVNGPRTGPDGKEARPCPEGRQGVYVFGVLRPGASSVCVVVTGGPGRRVWGLPGRPGRPWIWMTTFCVVRRSPSGTPHPSAPVNHPPALTLVNCLPVRMPMSSMPRRVLLRRARIRVT
ncbi:MAG: hypothetical protein ACFN04_08775, partial [Propionibacterium acidifaciens]